MSSRKLEKAKERATKILQEALEAASDELGKVLEIDLVAMRIVATFDDMEGENSSLTATAGRGNYYAQVGATRWWLNAEGAREDGWYLEQGRIESRRNMGLEDQGE